MVMEVRLLNPTMECVCFVLSWNGMGSEQRVEQGFCVRWGWGGVKVKERIGFLFLKALSTYLQFVVSSVQIN